MNDLGKIYYPWITEEHEKILLMLLHPQRQIYVDDIPYPNRLVLLKDLVKHNLIDIRWYNPSLLPKGYKYLSEYMV